MAYNCFSNNIALEKEMLLGKHTTVPVQQLLPVCDKLEWVNKQQQTHRIKAVFMVYEHETTFSDVSFIVNEIHRIAIRHCGPK